LIERNRNPHSGEDAIHILEAHVAGNDWYVMDVSLLPKNVKVWNYRQISRFFKYGGGLGNRMSPNSPDLGNLAEILQILAINASSLFFAAAKW